MDLAPYVSALRDDLTTAAAAGDEQTRRLAAVLAAALEPAARLSIMNAASDLAAEVTAALGDRVVEVRLDGREIRVTVSGEPDSGARAVPPPFTSGPDAGDISRMTLRLVDEIKNRAEQAAAAQGVSLNAWVSQAVQGALQGRHWNAGSGTAPGATSRGSRVRGWVQG